MIDDLKAKAEGLGTVVTFTANWRTGDAWLAACDGACSQYAGGSLPGISPRVYRSVDGGVTWKPEGHLPPSTRFLGLYDANEIVVETWDESNTAPRYWLYPSGKDLEFPQGLDPATTSPLVLNSGTTVWRTRAGTYHDASGGQLFGTLFAEMYPPSLASTDIQYQHNYLTWTERPATPVGWDQAPNWSYVGHIDRDGQMTDLWGLAGDTMWITGEFPRSGDAPPALFGRFRFDTSRDYVRDVSFGAVLTLADGRLHRLTELDPPPGSGMFTFVHDLVVTSNSERPAPNRWLRVTGAGKGDCLNVRESPSADARVSTCVADEVLLAEGGNRQAAGGVEWVQVHTPGKMAGWVSAEFVR